MQNSKNYRTLYMIQVLTIVVLVLVLIMHVLPFFGVGPGAPHYYINPSPGGGGGGGYINPSTHHVGMHATPNRQASLLVPPLILQ